MSPVSLLRKLFFAFFILLLPYTASAAVNQFSCAPLPVVEHASASLQADEDADASRTQDGAIPSCNELDEPSSGDHLDLLDGLAVVALAVPSSNLAFLHARSRFACISHAPLKPPPAF